MNLHFWDTPILWQKSSKIAIQGIPTDEDVQDTAQLMSGTTCLPNGLEKMGINTTSW